jgi:hypothetical protein
VDRRVVRDPAGALVAAAIALVVERDAFAVVWSLRKAWISLVFRVVGVAATVVVVWAVLGAIGFEGALLRAAVGLVGAVVALAMLVPGVRAVVVARRAEVLFAVQRLSDAEILVRCAGQEHRCTHRDLSRVHVMRGVDPRRHAVEWQLQLAQEVVLLYRTSDMVDGAERNISHACERLGVAYSHREETREY